MDAPFIGMLALFGFNFPPRGWAQCNGQLLPIAQNTALFSLLGTQYGGNGTTTFGLPDLRGRVPIHLGQGPGLSNYSQGQVGGTENVTLLATEMPAHTHTLRGITEAGSTAVPTGAMLANTGALDKEYGVPGTLTTMHASAISPAGSGQPHSNMQPYLVLNYCIALQGIFPSRN
jgi:microcystin-dependent protein